MSQFDFGTIDPYVVDGVELADFLNQWRDALYSLHRGSVRPPYVVPGMLWINDSGGPNAWVLEWYVSPTVGDVALFTLNTTTGAVTVSVSQGGTFQAAVLLAQAAASPSVQWNATGNPVDMKNWRMTVDPATGALILSSYSDAGVVLASVTFNRDGTIGTPAGSLYMVGEIKDIVGNLTVAPAGWLLAIQGTIGSAASGASIRAAADCVNLYAHLWNTLPNSIAAVTGGRGASAAADFAANKPISGLDFRGAVRLTTDALGGTAAGRAPGFTAGVMGGESAHVLSVGELALHAHGIPIGLNPAGAYARVTGGDGTSVSEISTNNQYGGGGNPHNNMQVSRAVTTIIKL
jgi:hypothetical protein